MVKLLIGKGAKPQRKLLFQTNCFHVIKYLLQGGDYSKAVDGIGNTLLHKQCEKGNWKNVKYLIQHDIADVSAQNKIGQTPLHLACAGNQPLKMKIVKFLIEEQKADSAITCNEGKAAVHYAAENGLLSVLRYLVEEQKADPSVTCKEGKTALHYASRNSDPSILRYLIEDQKLDVEATDIEGKTVLHLACQNNYRLDVNWPTLKYLIKEQIQILDMQDQQGKTALTYCTKMCGSQKPDGFQPIALILAAKAKILKTRGKKDIDFIFGWIKKSYNSGSMKMSKAEKRPHISCLITVLQRFQKTFNNIYIQNPLLNVVSYCNRVDIAEYMFNQDLCYMETQFNAEEANFRTKLLLKSYLRFSCQKGLLDLTHYLFQEINRRDQFCQDLKFDGSLIETACKYKHIDVFKYLLEDEKAKDEAAEFLKDFPLHYACRYGSLEMVQYMIESGLSDFEAKDTEGQTLLYLALEDGSIQTARYLLEEKRACIDATNKHGRSVFQAACNSESLELVKYIQEKFKPDVNAQDDNGLTALHVACTRFKLDVVKFLITDMKANLHLVDKDGRTPLHAACQTWVPNVLISKFLVNLGANVLAKDKGGKIPLQVATSQRHTLLFLQAATKRWEIIYYLNINFLNNKMDFTSKERILQFTETAKTPLSQTN
jgi:ankyrin repeat protein